MSEKLNGLLSALAEKGIRLQGVSEAEVIKIAKGCGIEPLDYLPREVEVTDYTNKRGQTNKFVSTPSFVVGRKEDGSAQTVRGLFLRVEALDQAIADLQAAKASLAGSDEE